MARPGVRIVRAGEHVDQALHCGWCKAVLQPGREPASHGVCPSCVQAYLLAPGGVAPLRPAPGPGR